MSNPFSTDRTRRFMWQDKVFRRATRVFAFIVLALLVGILASLLSGSLPRSAYFGLGFLTDDSWNPVTEKFGALVPIYGTLATSIIALLIGVPLSFGIAVFLTELSPKWLKRPLGVANGLRLTFPHYLRHVGAVIRTPVC